MRPLHLDAPAPWAGPRFAVHHPARGSRRGSVLYLHPLAEEMNKARRMAAQQAMRLAAAGWDVLILDRWGCGDSAGDMAAACWAAWEHDVRLGAAWLRLNDPAAPLWLWGLRAGCLLAAGMAQEVEAAGLLLWQPQPSGKLASQQFLRLRAAAGMLAGKAGGDAGAVRRELDAGQVVEVAGYGITAGLIGGLEQATLVAPAAGTAVHWLELGTGPDPGPASARVLEAWRDAGVELSASVVPGPQFWQTTEIEDAPALWEATDAAMAASRPVPA